MTLISWICEVHGPVVCFLFFVFCFFFFFFIQQWNCSNRIDWIWCLGHFKVVGMATPQLKFQFRTVASWNEIINLQRGFAHKTDAVTGVGCLFIYLFQILFIYWFVLGVDFGFTSLVGGCMQIKISIDLHKVTTFIWPVFNRNPRQFFFYSKNKLNVYFFENEFSVGFAIIDGNFIWSVVTKVLNKG